MPTSQGKKEGRSRAPSCQSAACRCSSAGPHPTLPVTYPTITGFARQIVRQRASVDMDYVHQMCNRQARMTVVEQQLESNSWTQSQPAQLTHTHTKMPERKNKGGRVRFCHQPAHSCFSETPDEAGFAGIPQPEQSKICCDLGTICCSWS